MIPRSAPLCCLAAAAALCALVLPGCTGDLAQEAASQRAARLAAAAAIPSEPAGDYWVGRRYFHEPYGFWGYLRRPRQSWSTAQLVVLNENRALAPDRARGAIGSDDGAEYRLRGSFSGQKVYESASNRFLPEFVVTSFELVNSAPPSILPPRSRETLEVQTPLD